MLTKESICLTISFGRLLKEHLSVAQDMFGVYAYELVMVAFLVMVCSVETAFFQVETTPSQARPVPESPFSYKRSKGRWHMERPKSPANSAGRGLRRVIPCTSSERPHPEHSGDLPRFMARHRFGNYCAVFDLELRNVCEAWSWFGRVNCTTCGGLRLGAKCSSLNSIE